MTVHVVGAGLAGLAAGLTAARAGHDVIIYETAPMAGGRCRSFLDRGLGRVIDNGTHVVLGANRIALGFMASLGTKAEMVPAAKNLSFFDHRHGERWSLDVTGPGAAAMWRAAGGMGSRMRLLGGAAMGVRSGQTVAGAYGDLGDAYRRLIAPLATAALNAPLDGADARAFARVARRIMFGGKGALCPYVARHSLGRALVDPAVAALESLGAELRYQDPLVAFDFEGNRVSRLDFRSGAVGLRDRDRVIVAVPPWGLPPLPRAIAPAGFTSHAILCAHYLIDRDSEAFAEARMMGCIGGTAQWIARSGDILSVTVSAADPWMGRASAGIASTLWQEVCRALDWGAVKMPAHRVIKERRATAVLAGGFGPRSTLDNLYFAGGWTCRRRPDTIEAAISSGIAAARCLNRVN